MPRPIYLLDRMKSRCHHTSCVTALLTGLHLLSHPHPATRKLLQRLPIAKWFRPVQVSRDVRVLERGHWRIPITIASQAVVDEARTEMPRDQKLANITKQRDAPTSKERWQKRRLSEEARTRRRDLG